MSVRWWQWLILDSKAESVVRAADASLEADMIRWIGWPEEDQRRATELMVELLFKVIPGYRLDFQFYTQFVVFVGRQDSGKLLELAQHLNGIARAAQGRDEPLRFVADTLRFYVDMFALNTRSAKVGRLRAEVYSARSRSTNDLIQSYLANKLNDMTEQHEPM